MLFLWSREHVEIPKASPWITWIATAIIIWNCRRLIINVILAISPLRLFKIITIIKKKLLPKKTIDQQTIIRTRIKNDNETTKLSMILHPKKMIIDERIKQYCNGDGDCCNGMIQIHYRVTRSGRIYGRYPNKVVIQA